VFRVFRTSERHHGDGLVNETYVHPWDHPQPEADTTHPQISTTPRQVLNGCEVGLATQEVCCTGCEASLTEGESGVVYACRTADAPEWLVARCYCERCAPATVQTPTLGAHELLASATFGLRSQVIGQVHHLCLGEIDCLALSPPSEGTSP
jgi:hypothetical protein